MRFYLRVISLCLLIVLLSFFCLTSFAWAAAEKSTNDGIMAKSYILMEADSGYIINKKNEHQNLHPASITKLMTLLLTLEAIEKGKIAKTDRVTASELAMSMGGTEIWLEPGEQMTVDELLMAAAVGSANDACVALAEHISGSETAFVKLMNSKAKELGMKDTVYKNSNGLPQEGHHTSAYDIALLAKHMLNKHPDILHYTSTREHHLREGRTWLVNTNHLLGNYQGLDGLKTGWTEDAGFCLAATAKRNSLRLLAVVLGADTPASRTKDVTSLLNYGFANYKVEKIVSAGEKVVDMAVRRGVKGKIALLAKDNLKAVLPAGEDNKLHKEVFLPEKLEAPLVQGQEVGELRVKNSSGEIVGRIPVITGEVVEKSGVIRNIFNLLSSVVFFWKK